MGARAAGAAGAGGKPGRIRTPGFLAVHGHAAGSRSARGSVAHGQGAVESVEVNPAFWRGKKVFLTGHTGFKGSWLGLWLHSLGAQVTGYALKPPTRPSLFVLAGLARSMKSTTGDVRNLPALKVALRRARPQVVIHMAAQSLVRESYADPVGTY